MKKLLSFAIILALCLSSSIPALAVGKPGDTTVTDIKGNIHKLSKPILYTVTREDVQRIDRGSMKMYTMDDQEEWEDNRGQEWYMTPEEYLDESVWPLMETVYVVSEDTEITFQKNTYTNTLFEMDIAWKDKGGQATEFHIYNYPDFDSILLDGHGYLMSIDLETVAEEPEPDPDPYDGHGGSEGSGIRTPDNNRVTFYVLKKGETANPFASAAPASPTTPASPAFTDVAADAYYAAPVSWAVEKGITSGTTTTTFSPGQTCSTAQILTFLWRAKGSPEVAGRTNTFTDIKESDYFYKAALWAKEKGLVSGTSFRGNTPCTRSMVVNYLWKLAGSPSAPSASFNDVASTADYAKAVAWAVSKGITGGTTADTFSPDNTCTRGQIVTFLYRAYK